MNRVTYVLAGLYTLSPLEPINAAPIANQGTWQTTLQTRDLDKNGTVDALYDTDLNITWLRNANVNGLQTWQDASAWVRNFTFGGYNDWRLPTIVDTGSPGCNASYGGTDCGYNVQTKDGPTVYSEMAHLFYVTLGNLADFDILGNYRGGTNGVDWGLANTAQFQNLQTPYYWLGLQYASRFGDQAWAFYTYDGYQSTIGKNYAFYAMAIRSGDVTAVPEPSAALLLIIGFCALATAERRWRTHTDFSSSTNQR